MVRPPKPGDIKQTNPAQKSHAQKLKSEIEEKFKTEAPVNKKPVTDKLKNSITSPKTSAKNASNQKSKTVSPKSSKLAKMPTQPPQARRNSILQTKSHTSKPGSPVLEKQQKARKPSVTKKRSPLEAKFDPLNRIKITETEDQNKTTLPLSFHLEDDNKIKKIVKMGKTVVAAKKVKKSNLKKPSKDMKNLNLIKPESVTSLTNHFRVPYEINTSTSPNTKLSASKKRKSSTIQKRLNKSKPEQEDSSKDVKNRRKSPPQKKMLATSMKLPITPLHDKGSDSVPEIKHNDSFIISARKLHKTSSERRTRKSGCLRISATTTTRTKTVRNMAPKSCLKKNQERESKLPNEFGEFYKTEGKMKFLQNFHSSQYM